MHDPLKRSSEQEIGIVSEVKNGRATVELSFQEACESCGARMICVPDNKGKRRLQVDNKLNAQLGNQVTITEKSNFMLKISFLQYGLPLIGFMAAILILSGLKVTVAFVPKELMLFCVGLVGLFLAAFLSRHIIRKIAHKDNRFFEISEIITD